MVTEISFLGLALVVGLSAIVGYFIGFLFGARESSKSELLFNDRIMLYKSRYELLIKQRETLRLFVNDELARVCKDIEKEALQNEGCFFKQGYRLACLTILQRIRGEE